MKKLFIALFKQEYSSLNVKNNFIQKTRLDFKENFFIQNNFCMNIYICQELINVELPSKEYNDLFCINNLIFSDIKMIIFRYQNDYF